ncbi:hypothetical protein MRY87_11880 [bacterium]|nr:hypothetical protein [bacterium]
MAKKSSTKDKKAPSKRTTRTKSSRTASPLGKKIERKSTARKKSYALDLRIHSPASLGYLGIDGIDTAPAMVRLAKVKGLDVIAVTDFHSGGFIDRVAEAAEGSQLTVLPGVSLRCSLEHCDEVILIAIFPEQYRAADVGRFLEDINVPKDQIGNEHYTVKTPLSTILSVIDSHSGFAIPSRMDKTPHRLNALIELVEKYGFRTFDLAYGDTEEFFRQNWPEERFNLYSFSNASALAQVGNRHAQVQLAAPSFQHIKDMAGRAGIAREG